MTLERTGADRNGAGDRGLSSVLGLIVLVGIVITSSTAVLTMAGVQTTELRGQMVRERAESAMGELREEVGNFHGRRSSATVAFPSADDERVTVEDGSRLEVVVRGLANRRVRSCTFSTTMGSVRYRTSSGVLGYEGTGVFYLDDGDSVPLQLPELAYRTTRRDGTEVRTLDVPTVDVEAGTRAVGDDLVLGKGATTEGSCGDGNSLDYVREATVRIENSEFYEGWYDYLVEEFGRATKYDTNRTVVVRSIQLGRVAPGGSQPFGPTRRTGELLDPYDHSAYEYWTVHEVNWEVGTGTRSITGVRIDYEDGSVDLEHVDERDVRVFYVSSANLWNYDPTHNRTDEIADVEVVDNGTALSIQFEHDLAGNGGGTGANAHFVAQYRNVGNPRYGGNYSVDVSLNGDTRGGDLAVTGPNPPGPAADPDGLAGSSNTYVVDVSATHVAVCGGTESVPECSRP